MKKEFLIIALLVFICSIIGCLNTPIEKLVIKNTQYSLVTFDDNNTALVIAWETNKPSYGQIIYCSTDNVCTPSGVDDRDSTLHLFICSTDRTIKTYTVRSSTPDGDAASFLFNNPLIK